MKNFLIRNPKSNLFIFSTNLFNYSSRLVISKHIFLLPLNLTSPIHYRGVTGKIFAHNAIIFPLILILIYSIFFKPHLTLHVSELGCTFKISKRLSFFAPAPFPSLFIYGEGKLGQKAQ